MKYMAITVNSIIYYEGKKCKVINAKEDEITLQNMDKTSADDWNILKITLTY